MENRIKFLKEKLQKYQEELDRLAEEEKLMQEIADIQRKIISAKIKKKTNKKTYNDLKREEVQRELEKYDYKEFMSENGRTYYVTTEGEFFSETKHLKKSSVNGYEYVSIDGKSKIAHRLIWQVFNGEIPEGMEIDHINTDRLDNRLDNLRLVTPSENKRNPLTIEHYKISNRNKGAIRKRNEKNLS